jgi:anti-sigma B factor antagonist
VFEVAFTRLRDSSLKTACEERAVVTLRKMGNTARNGFPPRTSSVVRSDVDDGQSSILIEGALDALTVHDIRPTIDAVVADRPRRVVVDFDLVTLLDSTGVGAIVSLFKRVKAQGGQVVVVRAHDQPLAVLKLLKLDAVFGL